MAYTNSYRSSLFPKIEQWPPWPCPSRPCRLMRPSRPWAPSSASTLARPTPASVFSRTAASRSLPTTRVTVSPPSYVAFMENGDRLVGDAAKNQAAINPANTVFDVKRLIGRNFSDKSVQADKKLVPYDIVYTRIEKPKCMVRSAPGHGSRRSSRRRRSRP